MNTTVCVLRPFLWLACAGALTLATSATLQAQSTQRPTWVYRIDTIPPWEVFLNGVTTDGRNLNLLDHARGQSCTSADAAQRSTWISTTSSRSQAERFLRIQFEHASQRGETPPPTWLYTIRTDNTYLNVVNMLQQVISAGRNNQNSYTPAHAAVLQQILATSAFPRNAEIVSRRIDSRRVMYAERANYQPTQSAIWQLTWQPGTSNPNFQAPASTAEMDNRVENLHTYVPPRSPDFQTNSTSSCFQTCDRTADSFREKRSPAAAALNYCPGEPSLVQALIGSED